jgi:WG containing repeat
MTNLFVLNFKENAKIFVPFEYDSPIYFHHTGSFAIAKKEGKERIIKQNGSISEFYDNIYYLKEDNGFGKVIRNNKWGVIDKDGNEIIPPVLDKSFKYGTEQIYSTSSYDKHGFLNEKGEILIPFMYDYIFKFTNQGLAVVHSKKGCGIINKKNENIIPFGPYDSNWLNNLIENPHSYLGTSLHSDSKYFYVPLTTKAENGYNQSVLFSFDWKLLSPAPYDDYKDSTGEYREVRRLHKCGLINRSGEEIIPCIHGDIYGFNNEYIEAWKDDGKGIIDFENKLIVPFIHQSINWEKVENGFIFICEFRKSRTIEKLYAVYNDKGLMVIPYQKGEIRFKNEYTDYINSETLTIKLDHLSIQGKLFNLDGTLLDKGELLKKDDD